MIPAFIFAGIPLIFIAAIVAFQLAKNVPDARSARANTVLSFETIRAANATDAAVQDAERGQRGFLITGQEAYLDPYTKAKERLPQLMVELQQATVASADQLPRLLQLQADPFFTTKPVGEGTGLGLPQVYGFVKQLGGHLKIYSEVGEGTTVKLYLPRSFGEKIVQPAPATVLAVTGTEIVLVVDDDQIVRATVASMLEDFGYTVLLAQNGSEALAILESGTKVHLLFTDVMMPGTIGGRQLAERAIETVPTLKFLFTSGYTENVIVHNGRLDAGVELISKPYRREQLAVKVRRVLDSARGTPRQAAEI